jgi:hypothetical protein
MGIFRNGGEPPETISVPMPQVNRVKIDTAL